MRTLIKIFLGIFIGCAALESMAQTNDSASTQKKKHKFTLYAGVGPNYYFNNLVLAKDYVNELNYSFVGRIMWEPEHNLSLGIESGYNRLYTVEVEDKATNGAAHIVNVAIPIQIVVSMKFFENFYASFLIGQSILKNQVHTAKLGDVSASTISLGDFGAAMGYKRVMSDRFYLGAEIKGLYSSKLQDRNIALVFVGGFRF